MMFVNNHPKLFILTLLLLFVLSSCEIIAASTEESTLCSPDDCGDPSLNVTIIGDIPDEFIMVFEESGVPMVTVKCPSGVIRGAKLLGGCDYGSLYLIDYDPDQVLITMSWDDTSIEQVFQPQYIHQWDSLGCPSGCREGEITFVVP